MTRKYKVMLVDDEEDVVNVIRKKIDWDGIGLCEPVYAANGLEALEKAEQIRPDIVMTDIKMPYMDGLALSRSLKKAYPNIRIIIFSGFDEFEYAKEAVRLAAEEYILKPVDSAELSKVFTRIKNNLDKEISDRQNQRMLEQYYTESLPVLRELFCSSLIQGRIPSDKIDTYKKDYQVSLPGPYFAVCIFFTGNTGLPEGMSHMLMQMSVRKLAEDKISEKWSPRFFSHLDDLCMIVSLDHPKDSHTLTDDMDTFCRLANSILQASVTCGIGQVAECLSELPASYDGAHQAVSYRVIYGTIKAINIAEIAPSESKEPAHYGEMELREVFKLIKLDDSQALDEAVEEYLRVSSGHTSVQSYRLFVFDIIGELCRFARNNELDLDDIFGNDETVYNDIQSKDKEDLAIWMRDVCRRMQSRIQERRNNNTRNFVEKAMDYVRDNYSDENLSIADICSTLGVSAAYFSTVFRKETGQTFISYLTDCRMKKAVELLIEHDEKTYVIAQKVGYSDPNYFSYVFRKQFGVSPSKYKQNK